MDKIEECVLGFLNGNMYCVGSEWAINDLSHFFSIQTEDGKALKYEAFIYRIINNRIYCRFKPKNLHGLYIMIILYFTMKKQQLWIRSRDFDDAMFLADQERVAKLLRITEEDAKRIKEKSFWRNKFLY